MFFSPSLQLQIYLILFDFVFMCVRVVAMIGADIEPDATLKVFSLSGRVWGCGNQHATNRVPAMCPSSKTHEVCAPLSFSPPHSFPFLPSCFLSFFFFSS